MKPTANGTWEVERDGLWIEIKLRSDLLTFQTSASEQEIKERPSMLLDIMDHMIAREVKAGRLEGYIWIEDRKRESQGYSIFQRVYARKEDCIIHGQQGDTQI